MATEREMLEAVDAGDFACQRGKDADFDHNYAIARLLNQRGYFLDFLAHRENSAAEGAVDLFSATVLSSHGYSRLDELRARNAQGEE